MPYPTRGIRNIIFKSALVKVYVSSQEGNYIHRIGIPVSCSMCCLQDSNPNMGLADRIPVSNEGTEILTCL